MQLDASETLRSVLAIYLLKSLLSMLTKTNIDLLSRLLEIRLMFILATFHELVKTQTSQIHIFKCYLLASNCIWKFNDI